jgi:hypothetical protein
MLPMLATYMGHVHYSDTAYYLTATPDLLRLAAERCERALHEEQSMNARRPSLGDLLEPRQSESRWLLSPRTEPVEGGFDEGDPEVRPILGDCLPASSASPPGELVHAEPVLERVLGNYRRGLLVFWGAAWMLGMLIVVNLAIWISLTIRARSAEYALREAIDARGAQLFVEVAGEIGIVATAGAMAGLLAGTAAWGVLRRHGRGLPARRSITRTRELRRAPTSRSERRGEHGGDYARLPGRSRHSATRRP